MNDECPIWGPTPCEKILINLPEDRYVWYVYSPRAGGKYIIIHAAYGGIAELSKIKLSQWIYGQNQLGGTPEIWMDTLKEAETWLMPSVPEQMDYCLQFLKSKAEAVGGAVNINSCSDEIQAATLLKNKGEIRPLIEAIRDEDWIKMKPDAESDIGIVAIRRKGYLRLEELKKTNVTSEYRSKFNNQIDDEIIAKIRRSRFLVADFTSDPPENARGNM